MLTQRKASRAFALSSLDSKFMAIFEKSTDDADVLGCAFLRFTHSTQC